MTYCQACGTQNDSNALFCENCGTKLKKDTNTPNQSPQYSTPNNNYPQGPWPYYVKQNYPNATNTYYNTYGNRRTTEMTVVLVLLYIEVAILGLLTFIVFVISPLLGAILFIITGLFFWLFYSVQRYNNTARIIALIIIALGLLSSLQTLNFISIAIGIFEFYVLAFHQPTVNLFMKQRFTPNYNYNYNYYSRRY